MSENIAPHIGFHLRTHNMSEISDIEVTKDFQQDEADHHCAEYKNRMFCLIRIKIYNFIRNIPDKQGYHKRHGRPQDSEKHVTVK